VDRFITRNPFFENSDSSYIGKSFFGYYDIDKKFPPKV